jgi:hypothetical protein
MAAGPLAVAGPLDGGAASTKADGGIEQIDRKAFVFRGAQQSRIVAVTVGGYVLRLHPKRRAAGLLGVERKRNSGDAGQRIAIGALHRTAEADQPGQGGANFTGRLCRPLCQG